MILNFYYKLIDYNIQDEATFSPITTRAPVPEPPRSAAPAPIDPQKPILSTTSQNSQQNRRGAVDNNSSDDSIIDLDDSDEPSVSPPQPSTAPPSVSNNAAYTPQSYNSVPGAPSGMYHCRIKSERIEPIML